MIGSAAVDIFLLNGFSTMLATLPDVDADRPAPVLGSGPTASPVDSAHVYGVAGRDVLLAHLDQDQVARPASTIRAAPQPNATR
ncbi:hypothetical protein GCM10027614_17050 [Micromonospora vulcania]